jgi:hypothetical protein
MSWSVIRMAEQQDRKWLWVLLAIFGIGALIGIVAMASGLTPTPTPGKKCKLKIRYDYTGYNRGTIKVDLTIREKTTNRIVKEWDAIDCDYTPNKRTVEYDIDKGTYILWMSYPSRTTGFAPQYELPIEFSITDTDLGAEKTVDIELNISTPLPPPSAPRKLTIQITDGRTETLSNLNEAGIRVAVVISDPTGNATVLTAETNDQGIVEFDIPAGYCVDIFSIAKGIEPYHTLGRTYANDDQTQGLTMNTDRTLYIPFRTPIAGVASGLLMTYENETPKSGVMTTLVDRETEEGSSDDTVMFDTRFAGWVIWDLSTIMTPSPGHHLDCSRNDYAGKTWTNQYVGVGYWFIWIMDKPVANVP